MTTKTSSSSVQKNQSSNLVDILSKDGADFKTLITKPLILEGLNCNVREVKIYLSKHLPRLLKTALREDTTLPTLSAMKILTSKKSYHITNLVKTSYFSDFCTEYLSKDNISPMIVGRLSEIALSLFSSGCSDFFNHAGFVILFLKYVDNYSVCDFFVSLFDFDVKLKTAQDWLFEIGFDNEIASILQNLLSENWTSNDFTFSQEKKISLLKIINKALENKRTRNQILEGPLISIFLSCYKLPTHVHNYYWMTINNMYDNITKDKLFIHAKEARNIFINPVDSIHVYCLEALKFLKKYVESNPELFDSEFIKSLITLMMQFENCELFLVEAAKLIIFMCKSSDLSERMIKYSTIFVNEAADRERSPFQMISLAISKELAMHKSTKDFFQKIELPPDFIKRTLRPYVHKLNAEYGVSSGGEYEKGKVNTDQMSIINNKSFWDVFTKVNFE